MNRKIMTVIVISGCTLLSSCAVYNFTRDKKSICEIHGLKLRKTWVKLEYIPPSWPPEPCSYSVTKQAITSSCETPRGIQIIRLAKVYSCDICNKQFEAYH